MKVVDKSISNDELKKMSEKMFGGLVKAVVDIEKNIMVVDAELHSDEEKFLLDELGSHQDNLWGINIYPDNVGTDYWIEFDSMINMRPSRGNKTRSVDDPAIREKILHLVGELVKK